MHNSNFSIYKKTYQDLDILAKDIYALQFKQSKYLPIGLGKVGSDSMLRNIKHQLHYLSTCMAIPSFNLFSDYINWLKTLLTYSNVPAEVIEHNFNCMIETLGKILDKEEKIIMSDYMHKGLEIIRTPVQPIHSFVDSNNELSAASGKFLEFILGGRKDKASSLILDLVKNKGVKVEDIYMNVFQVVLFEIGHLWQLSKINIAQEHYCSAYIELIMSQLYSGIFTNKRNKYSFLASNICNEYHTTGLRMVSDYLEMSGWNVFYFGANTPNYSILEMVGQYGINVLGISVTMVFNLFYLKELISEMRNNDKFNNVKIMVGGQPFNIEPELWKFVGADAYSANMNQALAVADRLICEE